MCNVRFVSRSFVFDASFSCVFFVLSGTLVQDVQSRSSRFAQIPDGTPVAPTVIGILSPVL